MGMNGTSLNLEYLHPVRERHSLRGGLEFGYTGWGSQVLLSTGYRFGNGHGMELEVLNGMALYRQGVNYVVGTGAAWEWTMAKGRNGLLISSGIRFSMQPAYEKYSDVYAYVDLPLRIRWVRRLKIHEE
jgi:hypothetical protein